MAPKKVQSTVRNYEAGIHKFFSINGATNRTSLNQITNSTLTEVFRITEGKIITSNLTISGGVNFTDGNILTSNLIVSGNIQFNNTSLKNNIQVTPLRQVFNVQSDTQSLFTLSTEGIYGGEASNAQVFIGQRLLRYYDSNIKDYDLTILRNVDPPITNYTITLSQPVVLGNYVDITVFPQLLPESTPQGFVYQNVVLDATSFTTFAKNGNQIYYNNGNVGIGTANPTQKLHVEGNIVCSNINVIGDFVTLNTITSNTEQVVIENAGTGPALKVTQTGNNSVAEFYDNESGLAMIVGNNGNIGIGTNNPQAKLHVNGDVTLNNQILNINGNPILKQSGSIINTVCVDFSSSVATSSSGFIPSLTASITPSSVNSKILIQPYFKGLRNGGTTGNYVLVYLYRGASTSLKLIGDDIGYAVPNNTVHNISSVYLDTPNTLSTVTYQFYANHSSASGISFIWRNGAILLSEIAQ